MPLLNITGVNSLFDNFNVGFGLSRSESEEDFNWHLNCLKCLQETHNIGQPAVILSDFCRGFKQAARSVYPSVPQQLCVWHIMKNVNHHIKVKWVQSGGDEPLQQPQDHDHGTLDGPGPDPPSYKGPYAEADDEPEEEPLDGDHPEEAIDSAAADRLTQREGDGDQAIPAFNPQRRRYTDNHQGFGDAWAKVVYADDQDTFNRAWKLLCDEFPTQKRMWMTL
jgi:hypothetical protein